MSNPGKTVRDEPLLVAANPIWRLAGQEKRRGTRPLEWRRAVVRAAAREVVAEDGVEGLQMRRLAERCCIATQTLYNNFGSRDGILLAAIEEHTEANLFRVWQEAAETGTNPVFLAAELTTRLVEADFKFMRQLLSFIDHNGSRHPLVAPIIRRTTQSHLRALRQLQASNELKPWVDCDAAVRTVQRLMNDMLGDLVDSSADTQVHAVGREYRMATGSYLLGIVCGKEAERLEQSVAAQANPSAPS